MLLVPIALAGDLSLYQTAISRIDERWLWPEQIDHGEMFREAGRQLERSIEWLVVGAEGDTLHLRGGRWQADVRWSGDLPAAFSQLEDAVKSAGLPVDADTDVRVEILRGAVRTLDRHSTVLHAAGLERFDERLSGTLTGIGVTIGLVDRRLTVRKTFEAGPAVRAGIEEGDTLVRIDGVSTIGMVPASATDRIRGPAGTRVTLTVLRGGRTFEVVVPREEVSIPNVTASTGPDGIGVLTIDHFSEQTVAHLQTALARLRDDGLVDRGVIIDLRGNTGGSLIQSARTVDAFVQEGLIVTTAGRGGDRVPGLVHNVDAKPEEPVWSMPIAVLMDHATASGAEILAGALGVLDRAVLIGESSFGKGHVQSIYQLDPAIKLKLTVAEYVLANSTRVAGVGLDPDLAVEPHRFGRSGAWYPDPTRSRPARVRLPRVVESEGWRPVTGEGGDPTLSMAAAVLADAATGARSELLRALDERAPALVADAERRVVEMFALRDIDWSRGPLPVAPAATADLTFSEPPTGGRTVELRVAVVNRGDPLHRVAVRLRSVNRTFDDIVLPIGRLPAGASAEGTARIQLDVGETARTDLVTGVLEAEGVSPLPVLEELVAVGGSTPPPLAVSARLAPAGDRVLVDLYNRGDRLLTGVRVRFEFPDLPGVELAEPAEAGLSLEARRTATATLGLHLGEAWTSRTVPLTLVVEADGWGRLARWELSLRRDGGVRRVEPPAVAVREPPAVAPVGDLALWVRVADDAGLDHVMIEAGAESVDRSRWEPDWDYAERKIAWYPGSSRRVDLDLSVPVVAGTNRYRVVAEDRHGLRTTHELYVWGTTTDAATAEAAPTP